MSNIHDVDLLDPYRYLKSDDSHSRYPSYQHGQSSNDRLPESTIRRTHTGSSAHTLASSQSYGSPPEVRCSSLTLVSPAPRAARGPHLPPVKRPTQYGGISHPANPSWESFQCKVLPEVPRTKSLFGRLFSGLKKIPKSLLGVRCQGKRGKAYKTPVALTPHPPHQPMLPSLYYQSSITRRPLPFPPPPHPSAHGDPEKAPLDAALVCGIRDDPDFALVQQVGMAARQKRARATSGRPIQADSAGEEERARQANLHAEDLQEQVAVA
ncbi:unnamed protein product [Cyclocybe aegerita]|uniref:Uncharacterized protein n=1 Tax=Cyclocybe aegerita TaxID=1973307 RepID=A0A8S0WGV8_CYCAE|nr:unnamed protein product [Cyclocybe aegerita]